MFSNVSVDDLDAAGSEAEVEPAAEGSLAE